LAWRAVAALALPVIVGCQTNNTERDIMARERRMQEDQMYAMEDYISQYQKLVCRYRSENATLRQQLQGERCFQQERRQPQPMPTPKNGKSSPKNGPRIDVPSTPNNQQKPATPQLETPEVPSLKETTPTNGGRTPDRATRFNNRQFQKPRILAASYNESTSKPEGSKSGGGAPTGVELTSGGAMVGEAAFAAGESSVPQSTVESFASNGNADESPAEVLLSGEVIANDNGGGPRLMIDVEPFTSAGQVVPFDGSVSLMLLSSDDGGGQRAVARWNFGPDEVQAAMDPAGTEPSMRFYVELPAGAEVGQATELWARLMPQAGAKLLAHASVELSQPGVFSSRTDKLWPSEESVITASYTEPSTETANTDSSENTEAADKMPHVDTVVNAADWTIARPGKPANLPADSNAKWRASSEQIPIVESKAIAAAPKRSATQPAKKSKSPSPAPPDIAERPAWSPERPSGSTLKVKEEGAAEVSSRPAWSSTR
jgi:hypothetical protein